MFDSRWGELSPMEKLVTGVGAFLVEAGVIFLVICLSWVLA